MAEPLKVAQSEAFVAAGPSPVSVFQGYDSVSGAGRATAVVGSTQKHSAKSHVYFTVCETMTELSDALEVNQSLTVAFGKVGSIDQKMKFINTLKVTTHSVEIVVYAKRVKHVETSTDYKLKDGIKVPQGPEELAQFFRGYGNSFLGSVVSGGEYYAVYTFYSQTQEQQTTLVADMKAAGLYSGVSVDASLQTKLSKFLSSTTTRTVFKQDIAGISKVVLPTAAELCAFALKFTHLELDLPVIIAFATHGYENLPNFGDFQPIVKNRNFFLDDRKGLVEKLVEVQELQDQIELIEEVYDLCGGYKDEKLAKVKREAAEDHDKIDLLIERWEQNPTQTFNLPDLPSLEPGTPTLNYKIDKSPAFGGNGGSHFDDVSATSLIPQETRVTAVQLRTGWVVTKLTTWYRNSERTWHAVHGKDDDGQDNPKLELSKGEVITKVSGRADHVIRYLTISTNRGRETKGGGSEGTPFDWSATPGSFALGFAGRSGSYLDQIQVVYGSFLPAVWQKRRGDAA